MAQSSFCNARDVSADNAVYQHSTDSKHHAALIAPSEERYEVAQRIPHKLGISRRFAHYVEFLAAVVSYSAVAR